VDQDALRMRPAEKRGHGDVRVESFDETVLEAYEALHPIAPELG
jgi:hypothetical protein